MCWEFKDAFTDCPADCSKWKTTEKHPTYGEICSKFAHTGQHCKKPTRAILGENSQVQASGTNPDPGGPTETPDLNSNQLQIELHQNPHSAHQTATHTGFRGGLQSNLSSRQQRGVWHN
ncbi:hypothetical protein BGAL_0078g00150 [Botrytis galanthina]|uniref:Uncharacterized protein n=1 Tax=Botrytis galanthina TaxID=278940 RepID=A0A4V4HV94_9HELO|nr:hypothetical protein BGAL_0078g00150 [Botrytis galanthina]